MHAVPNVQDHLAFFHLEYGSDDSTVGDHLVSLLQPGFQSLMSSPRLGLRAEDHQVEDEEKDQ